MKRIALSFAVALITVACATMSQTPQGLVSRGIQAQGGADALAGIKTISVKGTMKQWEPEQSMTAGGEMRFANEATFVSDRSTTTTSGATSPTTSCSPTGIPSTASASP